MKNILRTLAVTLAIGATFQVVISYAAEIEKISAEEEEVKLSRLMELRREVIRSGDQQPMELVNLQDEFPQIKNTEDYKREVVRHTLRYLQSIGAEKILKKEIQKPEFQVFRFADQPGI